MGSNLKIGGRLMRMGNRLIREKPLAARIVNCPLFPVGEYYCHARCP